MGVQFHILVTIAGNPNARTAKKTRKIVGSPQGEERNFFSAGKEVSFRMSESRVSSSQGRTIGRFILMLVERNDRPVCALPKMVR